MKYAKITLAVLIILTLISAIVANANIEYAATIILLLAALKFMGITYYFMELIKAHVFWRTLVSVFVVLLVFLVLII